MIETDDANTAQQLAEIASRYHATPRHEAASADALSDLVVVPTLREAIVSNILKPGTRLIEVALTRQLGVSRTPVREAFLQLEREGLVTVVARTGVFVRQVTPRDVDEIYTVRSALESLAIELAARQLTAVGKAQLDEALEAMHRCVESADPVGYTEELDGFYAIVMRLADNAVLQHTHDSLLGPVRRLRRIAMSSSGRMRASYEQSVRIRDALTARDGPSAALLIREQLANACTAAKAVLQASAGG
ncbi:GntR family transcriptional regulator [Paucibacter sp. R3-3]|uniref:GntR family transcriptional regulator n=1 Tax=Roseateles agri TaxID=3098619 RepID=A0ABU5DJ73_9BURK|nr:GntR family transcriptional regulator [Paucibacter sp. R3-3]MDY0746336.1 GntR family transcriptional regulator [Paucibacter sp. R3-3]